MWESGEGGASGDGSLKPWDWEQAEVELSKLEHIEFQMPERRPGKMLSNLRYAPAL